ncbi:5-deoxy-glucuronate isomerase [Acidisoma cellulosilytica]|uniref:5-deoxy-glucuronate isomerase n=1 Tax=Acidisoma cellulosilyticum TaxID=2802395 RepID=A0A964E317_9PROT|nr:5-deoxy-glucuronate isomerase [Acidisoma cellulosilyticum]MCB8879899.1 5-deoxy-glucuronate isomerase [Acidisoma cellulosilyticum]
MASKLLVHPHAPDRDGFIHHITPASAGWFHVGFSVLQLSPQKVVSRPTEGNEVCLVILSGRVRISAGDIDFGLLGERESVFDGLPWSVYIPAKSSWTVEAETAAEVAVCASPAEGKLPARIIPPSEVGEEVRGKGTNTRHVRNILPDTAVAESLLVVEVVTPGGNWSSYPPHKHDVNDPPRETYLEETYYHRLKRGSGFALQRVYTDDRSLDETMAIGDGDVVLVPRGYHPVGAPHGFDLFYLNVMAGPVREWRFTMSPDHAFLTW